MAELLHDRTVYPLSYQQRALWFQDQIAPASAGLNLPTALRIRESVDVRALERAVGALVARHEAFRITCLLRDGVPWQKVQDGVEAPLERIDAAGWSEAELREGVTAKAYEPFDLQRGPVFRGALFTLSAADHVLLLAWHHIALDDWSLGVAVADLGALYAAYAAGEEPDLPPAAPYSEFVHRQWEMVHGEEGARHGAYWEEQLRDVQRAPLPIARPRSAPSGRCGLVPFGLGEALTARIKLLAQELGATPYMVLLAAFFVLLERYCGQSRVLVSAPAPGRTEARFARTAGCLVNQVVLRADVEGRMTFRDLVAQVKATVLGALEHQDYPLALVSADLPQLTRTMFVLQGEPVRPTRLGPLAVEHFAIERRATSFDLDIQMTEAAGTLWGSIAFSLDLFEEAAMRRMAGHLQALLEAAVAEPLAGRHIASGEPALFEESATRSYRVAGGEPVARMEMLSRGERQTLAGWNSTAREWPDAGTLPDLFERQAARTPEAVAARCAGESITYAELDRRANQVAQYLHAAGVGPEAPVGIHMARSLDMLAAVVGVLKAGAAYVPLDPSDPPERLRYMRQNCGAAVVLETLAGARDYPAVAPPRRLAGANLAYIIYTSGSTGAPKGVMGTHGGAVNRIRWMWEKYPFGADEIYCQRTSLSRVDSVWEIFGPLTAGVPLLIMPDELVKDTGRFAEALGAGAVTRISVGPWLLRALLDYPLPPRLKYWITSGEPLAPDLARRLHERLPEGVLLNLYGCAEASGDSCCAEVPRGAAQISVGGPIANTTIHILDRHGNQAPEGVPGEITIGGEGLARGYWGREAPEQFGAFLAGSEERLYRTGDLGRRLADGSIEYLGRGDGQVKIRGARVETEEVEAALTAEEAVAQAAVYARQDSGEARLVACVVFRAGARADVQALRTKLAARLPGYMVPAHFMALDALPLLPNGKVDRAALPAPEPGAADSVKPRTPLEELLAGVWAAVLRLDHVGTDDDFFDLGGHSLEAAQAISRLRAALQKDLPLRLLFENPSVRKFAAAIGQGMGSAGAPPLRAAPRRFQVPLSFGQQRLWYVERLGVHAAYNIAAAVRLDGRLNLRAARAALREIVRRHQVLRTRVVTVEGELRGVVERACEVPWAVEDVEEADVYRRAVEEARRPFDLGRAPLIRSRLLRLSETAHVLVTTMHHLAADDWSVGVLAHEFSELYCGRSLPELPLQFSDYAAWQRDCLAGERLETGLAYWRRQLAGAPDLVVGRKPRPARPTGRGARVMRTLAPEAAAAVKALSRQEDATLFMTLLAAYQILLAANSGVQDIVVGCPFANRSHPEVQGLIGFFVNTMLLRTNLSGAATFRDVLARAREACLGAYTHQDVPIEKIVDDLRPRRQAGRNPLFNAVLALHDAPLEPVELPGLRLTPYALHNGTAKFDLSLDVLDLPEGLVCALEYARDALDETGAAQLLAGFTALLEAIAGDFSIRISRLLAAILPAG